MTKTEYATEAYYRLRIAELEREVANERAANDRVRGIHFDDGDGMCNECRDDDGYEWDWVPYPCATARAIEPAAHVGGAV